MEDARGLMTSNPMTHEAVHLRFEDGSSGQRILLLILGDPEALEYGDFHNVYHEGKNSCCQKRSYHHE
jgi:hypothetical protein